VGGVRLTGGWVLLGNGLSLVSVLLSAAMLGPGAAPCPSPGQLDLLDNPVIQQALDEAWVDSQEGTPEEHEEGGYVYQCGNTTASGEVIWTYEIERWPTGEVDHISAPDPSPAPGCRTLADFHTHPGAPKDDPRANDKYSNDLPSDEDFISSKDLGIPGIVRWGLGDDPADTDDVVYGPETAAAPCPTPVPAPTPTPGGDGDGDGAPDDGDGNGSGDGGGGPGDTTDQDFPSEPGEDPEGGESVGDPHLITFDGYPYDFQAVGEHVLVESTDDDFAIQARHEPILGKPLSLTSAIAASVDGVTVEINDQGLFVDGERTQLDAGLDVDVGGGTVSSDDGNRVIITWPDGSELGKIGRSILIRPSVERQGRLQGLLGDWDGDYLDDLVADDDELLLADHRLGFDEIHEALADRWRVSDDTSLFTYDEGKSTESYTVDGFPSFPMTTKALDPLLLAQALDRCRQEGTTDPRRLENCALDVGASGDDSFAAEAARSQDEAGATIDTDDDTAPLLVAAHARDVDEVRRLIGAGADLEIRDSARLTPLLVAVFARDAAVAAVLLDAGADPENPWNNDLTPLHLAASFGDEEIVALLLDAGADATLKNEFGDTPADSAREQGHDDLARELE
jgi:hypothetical protein